MINFYRPTAKKAVAFLASFIVIVLTFTSGFSTSSEIYVSPSESGGSNAHTYTMNEITAKQSADTIIKETAVTQDTISASIVEIQPEAEPEDISTCESFEKLNDSTAFFNDEILLFFSENCPLLKRVSIVHKFGGVIAGYVPGIELYKIKIEKSSFDEIQKLCRELEKADEVELACPSFAAKHSAAYIPNDPWCGATDGWDESFPDGENWWLEAIEAPSAWEYRQYFNKIKIGIVDSGFDTKHEDLQGLFSFPTKLYERQNRPNNHGTHVAGIIAAKSDNGIGISGINPNAELVCCDWESDIGQLWISDLRIFTGFSKVVESGAKVVNFSIGMSTNYIPGLSDIFWNPMIRFEGAVFSYSMSRLLKNGYDFVVVQSAGNGDADSKACDTYKNGMFCSINDSTARTVSGVSKQDVLDRIITVGDAYFSPYRDGYYQVEYSNANPDICAPGNDIFSCYSTDYGSYGYMSGTSMAAPMVTGIASLVWAVNPGFTGAQVRSIVCDKNNTKFDAHPCGSGSLQTMSRVVNAKLCVEAALKASGISADY